MVVRIRATATTSADPTMRNFATGPTATTPLALIVANVVLAGYQCSSQIRLSREGSDCGGSGGGDGGGPYRRRRRMLCHH